MMVRIFDILLSAFALMLLFPLLALVVIFLRFTGEGEVVFKQIRLGRNRRTFELLKFATMMKDSPNIGTGTVTVKDDPRILPFGKVLRMTKINELPQLINILRGDMSLVGPRPLTEQTFGMYDALSQAKISEVRPGLSGVGSLVFRNEEEILSMEYANLDFYAEIISPYKSELECWFIDRRGIKLYFKVIILTIYAVLFRNSSVVWRQFSDIPIPPKELWHPLRYEDLN